MYINMWFRAFVKAGVGVFVAVCFLDTVFAAGDYRWSFSKKTEQLAKGEILVGIPDKVSSSQGLSTFRSIVIALTYRLVCKASWKRHD